jgi:hypothetical protein
MVHVKIRGWGVQTAPSSKEGSIADEPRKKKNRKQRYRENKVPLAPF